MGNGIANRNKTTRPDTDTRPNSEEFYEPGLNQNSDIRDLGAVGAFNDFVVRLGQVGGIKARRRIGGFHNGIEIINARAARRKQFGREFANFGFFVG